MGRPTKKEQLERKKLLKYFKRDSEIYVNFEQSTNGLTNEEMIYFFIDECKVRNTCNLFSELDERVICCTFNDSDTDGFNTDWDEIKYQELYDIDVKKHDYFSSIVAHSKSVLYNVLSTKKSKPVPTLNKTVFIEKFGEKTVQELYEEVVLNKMWKYHGEPIENYMINNHLLIKKNSNILIKELDSDTFEGLYDVDKMKRDYCTSLLLFSHKYRVCNRISKDRLIKIFGKEFIEKFGDMDYSNNIFSLTEQLTDVQNQRLKESISKNSFEVETVIEQEYTKDRKKYIYPTINKALLVEIDFTKPIDEVLEYINHLYKEYQNKKILDTFEFLNIKHEPLALYSHDIYKTNSHKPFNVLLADKLFIYDAFRNGLNVADMQNQIDNYRLKLKNIKDEDKQYDESLKDKIGSYRVNKYLETMIELIENGGFREFLNGYKK